MELAAALSGRTPGSQLKLGYMLKSLLGYFQKETVVILPQTP